MSRRLDIGVASYGSAVKLRATLTSLTQQTVSDYRIFVIHNPGSTEDAEAKAVIGDFATSNARIIPVWMPENTGYVGAVNKLLEIADTDLIAYTDNDVEIRTHGWDESLCSILENNLEAGWAFPGLGHFGFENGKYRECLWNAGYCWVLKREAVEKIAETRPAFEGCPGFNTALGHHEEVDYMTRMRLAGYRIGCCPSVDVIHHETATKADDASHKPGGRIHDGVVRWMNWWNRYFSGDDLKYSMTAYDPRATRYTDWTCNALYLERMTLHYFPDWNSTVETVFVPGVGEMDAVKVLKPKGPYVGRAI